jgi:hypothetical protein
LREGDILLAINDQSCSSLNHANAMSLIDNSGGSLNLRITRDESGGGSYGGGGSAKFDREAQASKLSSDFLDSLQFNARPYDDDPSKYSRREHTSVDGNTTSRTVQETERFGETTLTKVTNERYTGWNNVDKPSSTREEVFRTTGSGIRQSDGTVPVNPEGLQVTFDLGKPETGEFGRRLDVISPSTINVQKPGAWAPSRQGAGTPGGSAQGFLDARNEGPSRSFTASPFGGSRPAVWTPAKHDAPARTFDLGPPQTLDVSNHHPTSASPMNQNRSSPWTPTMNGNSVMNENSFQNQNMFERQGLSPRREEFFRTTSAIAKHPPVLQTFDLGKPPMEEAKENFAPPPQPRQAPFNKNNQPKPWSPQSEDLSWDLDLGLSRDSTMNSKSSYSTSSQQHYV